MPNVSELEIERISRMTPDEHANEALTHLKRIRNARASLKEVENELTELKERKKARTEALEEALVAAEQHYDNAQLSFRLVTV
jgi:hypothetical protein